MSLLGRTVLHRRFLVCASFLLMTAVIGDPLARGAANWLRKRPVPIRKTLKQLACDKLADFVLLGEDGRDPVQDSQSGTKEWSGWVFSAREAEHTSADQVALRVYYYTSSDGEQALCIPHAPEICYRQGGYEIAGIGDLDLPMAATPSHLGLIPARWVRVAHPTVLSEKDVCIAYLFCVNGRFFQDREEARLCLAKPWNRAAYVAMIECVARIPSPDRFQDTQHLCAKLLAAVIPQLLQEHFPTAGDIEIAGRR